MSQVNLSCVCALLVLILFQTIHFSECRKLKNHKNIENLKTSSSINEPILISPTSLPHPSEMVDEPQPPSSAHADGFRPTKPGHSPGIGHSLKNKNKIPSSSMTLPQQNDDVDEPRTPPSMRVDGFRPTTPGHSPGIGHSLQNKNKTSSSLTLPPYIDEVDEPRAPPPTHADAFRPTTPGHSPSIGHFVQN